MRRLLPFVAVALGIGGIAIVEGRPSGLPRPDEGPGSAPALSGIDGRRALPRRGADSLPRGLDVEGARATISGGEIRAHLRFLSSDLLEGRGLGTRGGRLAAAYIAAGMEGSGLAAPEGARYRPVRLVGSTPVPDGTSLAFEGAGGSLTPDYGEDFILRTGSGGGRAEVRGEIVFVGYGVDAPEYGWNDFAGVDVAGKVLLVLAGDPPTPPHQGDYFAGGAPSRYGRPAHKLAEAARRGAAGVLLVHRGEGARRPWSVLAAAWSRERFTLAGGGSPGETTIEGWIDGETAVTLLRLADLDLAALRTRAARRDFRAVGTGISVRAVAVGEVRGVETRNVLGLRPGSSRPGELVIVTSHYDHLGIGPPEDGDSIYNGAQDNAGGVSVLLEVAEAFASLEEPPARSVLFIATAAEEAGLLGAEAYVRAPVLPLRRTVAVVNVHGANVRGQTDDVLVAGVARSGVGAYLRRAARATGIEEVAAPPPEEGLFYRRDHLPFARAGVPSVSVEPGVRHRGRPEGWGEEMRTAYAGTLFHAPGDEFSEDFVFGGAEDQARVVFLAVHELASGDAWPGWNEGSEFRREDRRR